MIARRAVLTAGGASLLVIGGSAGVLFSQNIESAREPWSAAEKGFGDARLNALAYAILAPNPHNRQPWQVHLAADDNRFTLHCDLTRLLPETDPPNRQITIGFGAFLELFKMAAAEQGYRTYIDAFPQGEPYPILDERPIASIRIAKDESIKPDPLFEYALARRTVRTKFDTSRSVPKAGLDSLQQIARLSASNNFVSTAEAEQVERLKKLSIEGWHIESGTEKTHHESTALMRIGAKEVNAKPDGISLSGPMMEAYKSIGLLSREKVNEIGSAAHKSTVSFYDGLIDSAASFGWLSTPDNTRIDQLRAGADWLRLNLAATKLGLAMHPISQVLQEFPEMKDLYNAFHKEVSIETPARVQGLFRFGYAAYPKGAPRWPLVSRLVSVA